LTFEGRQDHPVNGAAFLVGQILFQKIFVQMVENVSDNVRDLSNPPVRPR
jgi:hypothetical protein